MTDVGRQVYRYFLGHGLSRAGAAGVVGNARQESSLNPNDPGGGLFQDIGSRAPSGRGPLQHQLDSAYHELAQMPGLLSALRHTGDPAKAARLFSQQFERPGEPMLGNRESYARQAARAYGGATGLADVNGGSPLETRQSVVQGAPAGSGGAIAALTQALAQQAQAQQQQPLGRPARPSFSAGPQLPEGARGVKPLASSSSQPDNSLKLLLAAAQAEAQAPGVPSVQTEQVPGAAPSSGGGGGGYVNPLPGFTKGRTDQGVDYSAKPGAAIRALGDGQVLGVSPDWYKGQPYLSYRLTSGPQKGKVIFVAEQITPHVKAGQRVRAGQVIGSYAPSGTGIEIGFGTGVGGQTLAKATTGYTEGQETDAGKRVRQLLGRLGAR